MSGDEVEQGNLATPLEEAEEQAARLREQITHLARMKTLTEVFGSITHELNQPLSAILTNAQAAQRMLINGADVNEIREVLNDIVSEDKRAGEVIHRLRQWLRKPERQQRSLNLNELVKDVLNLLRSYLMSQQVIVRTELAQDLPAVMGDSVELQQLLVNLIVNACDAMATCETAQRRLLIHNEREEGTGEVIVAVTDSGRGIPERDLERIFEPFVTTKENGVGLGLSVCRSIIAGHGRKLWATNNPDGGAMFHFTLPVSARGKTMPRD